MVSLNKMGKWFLLIALFLTAAPIARAQEAPSDGDIMNRINMVTPMGWRIKTYREIASQRSGDPISPEYRLRFEAETRALSSLYQKSGEQLGPFSVVIETVKMGENHLLFGTAVLRYRAGAWGGSLVLENDLSELGRPLGSFGAPVVTDGTEMHARMRKTVDANRAETLADLQLQLAQAEANATERTDDARSLEERLAAALAAQFDAQSTVEETRERLAAALAALAAAETRAEDRAAAVGNRQTLLATAREELAQSRERATASEKQAELLIQQVAALRSQIGDLHALLGQAQAADDAAQVNLQNLRSELNQALLLAAQELKRRQLTEAECMCPEERKLP